MQLYSSLFFALQAFHSVAGGQTTFRSRLTSHLHDARHLGRRDVLLRAQNRCVRRNWRQVLAYVWLINGSRIIVDRAWLLLVSPVLVDTNLM